MKNFNLFLGKKSTTFKKLNLSEAIQIINDGIINITYSECVNYIQNYISNVQNETDINDINSQNLTSLEKHAQQHTFEFLETFFHSAIADGEEYTNWDEFMKCEKFEKVVLKVETSDKDKKKLCPVITIDTEFEDIRRKNYPNSRNPYFTMDLDLDKIPSDVIPKYVKEGVVDYNSFANDMMLKLSLSEKFMASMKIMFLSWSGKGIKIIFPSNINDFQKEFNYAVELINDAIGSDVLSDCKDVYDYNASCIITTGMNIHKSDNVVIQDYPSGLTKLVKKKVSKLTGESIDKYYNKVVKKYRESSSKIDYMEAFHLVQTLCYKLPIDYVFDNITKEAFINVKKANKPFVDTVKGFKPWMDRNIFHNKTKVVVDKKTGLKSLEDCLYYYDKNKESYKINETALSKLIINEYFRVQGDDLYRVNNNILRKITEFENKNSFSLLTDDLKNIIETKYFKNDDTINDNSKLTIFSKIMKICNRTYINSLPLNRKDYKDMVNYDSRNEIQLFLKDGVVQVKKDDVSFREYNENDIIIDENIIKTNTGEYVKYNQFAKMEDYKSLPFYKKITGYDKDKKNFNYLCSIIGYLITTNRQSGKNNTVMFIDGVKNDDNKGGTGKSLVFKNLEYIRSTFVKPSDKEYDKFIYGDYKNQNTIYLDDLDWSKFDLSTLRSVNDLKFSVRGMYQQGRLIAPENTPRIAISSNDAPKVLDDADLRRLIVWKPQEFFNINFSVWDYFDEIYPGENWSLLEYEDSKDWSYWLNFMIHCCQQYLKDGINKTMNTEYREILKTKRNNEVDNTPQSLILRDFLNKKLESYKHDIINGLVFRKKVVITSKEIIDAWNKGNLNNKRITRTYQDKIKEIGDEWGYESIYKEKLPCNISGFEFKLKNN